MAFKLLPDGTLHCDSLDEALAAQAALANRLHPPSKARPASATKSSQRQKLSQAIQPETRPAIRTGSAINMSRLPHPISLTPIQQSVCLTVALHDEVDVRELTALHPDAPKDVGKFMKTLRELFAKAGYGDGDAMSWRVTGFGKNKRSVYSPGPSLLAAIE